MPTMCIIHKGFSGVRSIVSRINFSNDGYRRSPQSLKKSYTQRWQTLNQESLNNENKKYKNNLDDYVLVKPIQPLLAQIPVLEWIQQIGGNGFEEGHSIAVDASGNIYTTGHFYGTVDFDPETVSSNLTASGAIDIFIQKLDGDGKSQWVKQFGGSGFDKGISVKLDPSGNVLITGGFEGTVDFDPGDATANLTSFGSYDIFVLKLDPDGNFMWAKQMGGANFDQGNSAAVDISGNIYITGQFSGIADFGSGAISSLISAGSYDIFIQKLDAQGNSLWVKQMGGNDWEQGNSIAVDTQGNIYTTGYFIGTADFNPGEEIVNLTSTGGGEIFIQKLDANGNFLWVHRMGETDFDEGTSLAVDIMGNVYVIGYFQGTVDFNPGAEVANLISAGSTDIFVQKLDANGDFLWARRMGGTSGDVSQSIAVDVSENIYTTGWFQGTADFDPNEGTANLTSAGSEDIFTQKLYPCYPTDPVPDVANLPELSAMCEITAMDAPVPIATSNCVGTITTSLDVNFPITDQSITQIIWTYDDENGNVVTQNQAINWIPIDVTTTLRGDTITANNGNGTYQWLDCDNNNVPLSGETDQSFTTTINGSYAVEITENGCVDTSACISIIISSLSEFEHYEKLVVYPNPSPDNFKVEFGKVVKNAVLEVTDIQGKLVCSTQIQNSSEANIDLNETPGIYLLTIKSKENLTTIRLIKK